MSPARTRRPSPLASMGNPAAAAPQDDTTPQPSTPEPATAEPQTNSAQNAQEGPEAATPTKTRARATKRPTTTSGRRTTTGGAARPGRPRVPKPGPTTRVTVDLAQTEQRELVR